MSTPVCLIQWLPPNEYAETSECWEKFCASIDIHLSEVSTKAECVDAIRAWLEDNESSQFLYIGAHGIYDQDERCVGLGKDGGETLTWSELRDVLLPAAHAPVLWLGACGSSAVAEAWSPFAGTPPPAAWITTFPDPVPPKACLGMLHHSLNDTSLEAIVFVEQELPRLRKMLPGVRIEQYYPAYKADTKQLSYVSVDRFAEEVGRSFADFVKD